jgi:ribonuclease VapC
VNGVGSTIAVDTSVLAAVFLREEDPIDYGFVLQQHQCLIGWPTLTELHLVMVRRTGRDDQNELIEYLGRQRNIRFVDFQAGHFRAAISAFLRFGRGRHPAGLNFGDCLSYAIAKEAGVPLLFKGEDFAKTDILPATGTR